MKVFINQKTRSSAFVALLLLIWAINLSAQPSFSLRKDTLLTIEIEFRIDSNMIKRRVTNYAEGMFIDYCFTDSSIVTLFKGSNQRLPLLSADAGYKLIECEQQLNKTIRKGGKNGKYWREDLFTNGVVVCYDNVSSAKRAHFDQIVDSVVFDIVSSNDDKKSQVIGIAQNIQVENWAERTPISTKELDVDASAQFR